MDDPTSVLREVLAEIEANVSYMRKEVAVLEVAEPLRKKISSVLRRFEEALPDIQSEVRELEDRLSGEGEGDPRVTLSLIESWTRKPIELLDPLVKKLEGKGAAYVLVAESAANILTAWVAMKKAMNDVEKRIVAGS